MSQLLNIITDALEGIDLEGAVGGEAAQLATIADTVSRLTRGELPELGNLVEAIAEIDVPGFDFADDLTSRVNQVRDIVPTDIADLLAPVNRARGNIDSSVTDGVTDLIEPLINGFQAIQALIHTNFNFVAGDAAGDGGGSGIPEIPAEVGIVSGNSDTQIDPARLQAYAALVNELPENPSVGNLLEWFNERITIGRGDPLEQALRGIPFLDDVRIPLDTVLGWQGLSSSAFQTRITNTLQTLGQAITAQTEGWLTGQIQALADTVNVLDLEQLHQVVEDITTRLDSLKQHIDDATVTDSVLTTIEGELTALLAQRDALAQQFADDVQVELANRLQPVTVLAPVLEEKMNALLLMLQPPAVFGQSNQSGAFPPSMPEAGAFSGLESFLDEYSEIFENLMSALDISEISDFFEGPAEAMEDAADAIDEAITMVTMEITTRLNQAQAVIASLDLADVVDDAEQAIEEYTGDIVGTLSTAFTEVREAIEAVATQISTVVTGFNPAGVVATLEDSIDAVTVELERPEITAVLEVIEKLKSIAQRLDKLSFIPVTDEVVGAIDDMKDAVQGLGSNLEEPLKGLLGEAIGVLPDDLTPVTDPLIDGLGDVIEAGPIPLLEAIKDAPQEVVDAINGFDPGELIGDSLTEPFQNIISEIEAFEPDVLLDPLAAEIENFKSRLRENARPGDLLDPLIAVHEQILQDLNGFDPGAIIDPINEELTGAVRQITDSIPVADIFAELENVIGDIERILGVDGVADAILELMQTIRSYLTPFVDATEDISVQIRDWLDAIVSDLVDGVDVSGLQATFTDLNSALDTAQADGLQSAYDTAVAPLLSSVGTTLQPSALMTALVRSHAGLRSSWQSMTDSVEKTRIESILGSVNPTAPAITEVFTSYARVLTVLEDTRQAMVDTLEDWDQVFHDADGVLASYRQIPASPQELKEWLVASLDKQLLAPLRSIFEKFAPTARLLDAFIGPFVALVESLRDTVNGIIAAPAAIVAVGESLESIRTRLQEVNLDFISESVDEIFSEVKEQFRGLDPRGLKRAINASFDELLDTLSLDQVVPVDALNRTDDEIDAALQSLRQLDPQVLITEVLQPKFEEAIAPFVSALDVTPALTALTERLKPIESELETEMDRVNTAYQGFLTLADA